jgi:hypothetical protein
MKSIAAVDAIVRPIREPPRTPQTVPENAVDDPDPAKETIVAKEILAIKREPSFKLTVPILVK